MGRMWKSRHAGLNVKVRSALVQRHPVTGDIVGQIPAVRAEFGFATGETRFSNPLTGEFDTLEGFQGGFFDLDAMAAERGWDDDVKAMVERRLDELCRIMPNSIQSVDYIVPPAPRPWPTYDDEKDVKRVAEYAEILGLVGASLAYERENAKRPALIKLLEAHLAENPEPEPEPEPVVAVTPPKAPDVLERVIVS